MSRFNSLKVTDVVRETADAVSVAFEVPATLKQDYAYKQGQYLTLKLTIDGEEVRRSYSVCSSPLDNELRVAIKKVQQGKMSSYINDKLKAGDMVPITLVIEGKDGKRETIEVKAPVKALGNKAL